MALRLIVVSLGAFLGLAAMARVRRVEAAHAGRWGARPEHRSVAVGGAYRAARVTVLVARGVPGIVHAAAALGTLVFVLDVVTLTLAPLALVDRLGARPDQLRIALGLIVPLLVAGGLVARAVARDAERLARCDPAELETLVSLDWSLVHLGVLSVVAVLGISGASDALLGGIATLAIVLGALQVHLVRDASRRVREVERLPGRRDRRGMATSA